LSACAALFAAPVGDAMAGAPKRGPVLKPLPVHARLRGGDPKLISTIERRNGRRQVTYRGQALYYYVYDPKVRALCNDVFEFGGTWFALNAEGRPRA
jgi:hypothetical protein